MTTHRIAVRAASAVLLMAATAIPVLAATPASAAPASAPSTEASPDLIISPVPIPGVPCLCIAGLICFCE